MTVTLLLGCGAGPATETLVPDLRILAIVAEPPEVAPGEQVTLGVHTMDPAGTGVEGLLWSCLDLGDGCLEAALPAAGATVFSPVDGVASVPRTIPSELAPLVADGVTVVPVPLWALACAPGLCPVIDAARAAPEPGTAEAEALAAELADPTAWLAELPLTGVSLALTTVSVSARPVEERVTNPTLSPVADGPYTAPAGGELDLSFTVDRPLTAWGYTTLGGFGTVSAEVEPEEPLELTWYAPEEPGDGEMLIVGVPEEGGQAVWRTRFRVE